MFKFLRFPQNPKEKHADEMREKTHEVINDIQSSILKHQAKNKRDKEKIIRILSESEQELNSVAKRIAVATGNNRRPT